MLFSPSVDEVASFTAPVIQRFDVLVSRSARLDDLAHLHLHSDDIRIHPEGDGLQGASLGHVRLGCGAGLPLQ